jgi:hypothetical protein
MAEARSKAFKRVVISPTGDPIRAARVVGLLRNAGIEVQRTTAPFTSAVAHDYMGGAAVRRTFPAGSWVIDMAQPEARLATALLEPRAIIDSAFVRKQLDRYERNRRRGEEATREFYEFYDITAWSLPYTFGARCGVDRGSRGNPGPRASISWRERLARSVVEDARATCSPVARRGAHGWP